MTTCVIGCDTFTPPPAPDPIELPELPSSAVPPRPGGVSARVETPPLVSGRAPEAATAQDTLARTELLRAELELLRLYMGRDPASRARLRVADAKPRAVYRQVAGLFEQSNSLSFELSRTVGAAPVEHPAAPEAPDVFEVVDQALGRVLVVKQALGISQTVEERDAPADATPTDTFHAVVLASAEINHLLDRQTTPSDVYQRVTRAIHSSAAIHATLPGATLPNDPEFEANKTPQDVYRLLIECYREAVQLAARNDIELIELRATEADAGEASSHDVRELADLLAEELEFLRASWPDALPAFEAYDPGLKFPAHVHQRARYLRAILRAANERSP
ncbi:MAG: hypothetical protein AAGF12_14655 [Myxococcota bacterium]